MLSLLVPIFIGKRDPFQTLIGFILIRIKLFGHAFKLY